MTLLLAAVFAALIGMSLGLLGGGGSILTVPVFVYLLGFGPKEAIAASLAVVGSTSLFGAAGHWRAGNVNVRLAVVFGVVAMAGTFLGARLAHDLPGAVQLTLFAVVMMVAAWFMSRPRPSDSEDAELEPAARPMPPELIVGVGIGVGVLTGLVGVGGGFIIVPALVLLGRLPMKQAVGTSLLVIAMNSAAGFAGYWGRVEVPWRFLALFTAVAMAGILVGTRLSRRVPQRSLRRGFAVFLVVVAIFILYQNRGVFLPGSSAGEASVSAARPSAGK
ncbi:MAG TPA: sulfite exporter TauE/SafE family protein [Longimicrobium sp.]|nr:sulfite exporter TauE/SafE family protein [Longimicrobium sp.]